MELFHRSEQGPESGRDQGQSLVEMAFGMIIIVIILAGLVDLGRLWYIYTVLEDAAGEGALYMSISPYCPDTSVNCPDPDNASWRVRASSSDLVDLSDPLQTRIAVTYPDDIVDPGVHSTGELVTVTVEYDFALLTPFIQGIAGGDTLTLESVATQVIVTQ